MELAFSAASNPRKSLGCAGLMRSSSSLYSSLDPTLILAGSYLNPSVILRLLFGFI